MFWKNLVAVCNQHNTTPTALVNELGIAGGSVTRWKNGSVPRDTTLKKISDYFGVTTDYLLNGDTPKPGKYDRLEVGEITFDLGLFGDVQEPYTPEEQLLIQHWRSHPEAQPFVRKLLDMPEPEAKDADVVS